MKIHISMETKLLLDTLGRFFTEHRGLVDVKGKVTISNNKNLEKWLQGKLDTYWLLGKEGGLGKQLTISLKEKKQPTIWLEEKEETQLTGLRRCLTNYCNSGISEHEMDFEYSTEEGPDYMKDISEMPKLKSV